MKNRKFHKISNFNSFCRAITFQGSVRLYDHLTTFRHILIMISIAEVCNSLSVPRNSGSPTNNVATLLKSAFEDRNRISDPTIPVMLLPIRNHVRSRLAAPQLKPTIPKLLKYHPLPTILRRSKKSSPTSIRPTEKTTPIPCKTTHFSTLQCQQSLLSPSKATSDKPPRDLYSCRHLRPDPGPSVLESSDSHKKTAPGFSGTSGHKKNKNKLIIV